VRHAGHKSGEFLSIVCVCVCACARVCLSDCDPEISAMRKPEPTRAVAVLKNEVSFSATHRNIGNMDMF
jgi:hypothetical protein